MRSERVTSMGRSSSIVSGSGGETSGCKRGKERLCSWRVWCDKWDVRAVWAVINLGVSYVNISRGSVIDMSELPRSTPLNTRLRAQIP